ncbi:MAG: NADH-quinone oxidoreductase subunit C [Verrucomicrobiae bacterium]|nr:NADH-quinone oxidoreductase subunit C [Verrucomicrobiae bacterium]
MNLASFHNSRVVPLDKTSRLSVADFRRAVVDRVARGWRLAALFGCPAADRRMGLHAVMANHDAPQLAHCSCEVEDAYPALTPDCMQAHWFEREIAEQWGIRPEGHPWLKPIRFHASHRTGNDAWNRAASDPILPCVTDFYQVQGNEVHEVAVGPVHAGVIEPGHFRFQCHGEDVFHLEISLGYQHRGVERALKGGPDRKTLHYMETLAGDTTIGHSLAYAQALESLAKRHAPARAAAIRGIALELERLANHVGDLGALAGDVGFLPTASFCGRLRGDLLNMTALLCGNRFGRNLVLPGGARFDVELLLRSELLERLEQAMGDVRNAVELLWETPSVMARFEGTGRVGHETAVSLGLVGPAARACGISRDARYEFPSGIFHFAHIPVSVWPSGDVFARAYVRWLEIERSALFIRQQLESLPVGPVFNELSALQPNAMTVSMVEGWRGEICHVVMTDEQGRFRFYKVVDPSFHNWMGLAMALRNQQISDFPLCNKSFNLSYCGHDL